MVLPGEGCRALCPGAWEPGEPAALAAPSQETGESETGVSRERLEFSSKAMVQLTGKYTNLAESQKRQEEIKKIQNTFPERTESQGPKGTASPL